MAVPFKVKGVYEYISAEEDDLNFSQGQIVTVTEVVDDDWYMGEYVDASGGKHEGMFPKNFVEKYEPPVPSRPTRAPKAKQEAAPPPPPIEQPKEPEPEPEPEPQPEPVPEPVQQPEPEPQQELVEEPPTLPAASKPRAPPLDTSSASSVQRGEVRSPHSAASARSPAARTEPPAPKPAPAPAPASAPAEPAAPAASGAKSPPPVSEKPSSFKDRIAAFNKPAAAPVAPFKSGGGGGQPTFIKKPFVAPPPSKNAYIPQPKAEPVHKPYVRDEDPEIRQRQEEDKAAAEAAGFTNDAPTSPLQAEGEEGQQPQSLKERIALLQQQQREQAQRRSEGGAKEKPKKPAKKPSESSERAPPSPYTEGEETHEPAILDNPERKSMDVQRERPRVPSAQMPPAPMSPPQYIAEHDTISDGNEADLSAAGETTDDTGTIGPGDSDDTQRTEPAVAAQRAPAAPTREPDVGDEEDTAEEEEEEEEDDEARRRRELRERMAKMSGGMGMGAMFGPPGGMPMSGGPPKKKPSSSSSKAPPPASEDTPTSPSERFSGAPMVPVPGMGGRVQSPVSQYAPEVQKEEDDDGLVTGTRDPETMPDVEEIKPTAPKRTSTSGSTGMAPPVPGDRRQSQAPSERGAPPPIPSDRPTPRPPQAESRPVPPPPTVAAPMSPGPGSESDDEMSMHAKRSSAETSGVETPLPIRSAAPPVPNSREVPPRPTSDGRQSGYFAGGESASSNSDKRSSRPVPPVPGPTSPISPRPPPPPPPVAAPISRQSTDVQAHPTEEEKGESDYEGDYDTDIASSAKHKDALKSHAREPSGDSTTADETPVTSPLQTQPSPLPGATRAVPPPPPQAAPKSRASMETPRAPPPMPPPREIPPTEEEDEYDPYRYNENNRAVPPVPPTAAPVSVPPMPSRDPQEIQAESSDDMYSASPPRKSMDRPPPPPPGAAPREPAPPMPPMQAPSPQQPQPTRTSTRQSLDVSRQPNMARRSMDANRPNSEHGQIAADIDLAISTQWWTAQNPLPPALGPRNGIDILSESEESTTSKRGGRTTISKDIYILFLDYSQTIITARYDSRDSTDASLEQRHEPPPPRLRQDQLEDYWQRYGSQLASKCSKLATEGKKDTFIGDGKPHSLVLALLAQHPNALRPVGTRAYGALVYANLANASVQQFDEIRAGDVVTLRNAKFEGKAGAMHQKYKADVGMVSAGGNAGHVAVVEEWDGTRKKVRVWEQGREKGRLRGESYRLGDLRSGEVRVWRVVGREWVGWDGGA